MKRYWQQLKNVYHWLQAHWWRMIYRWPDKSLKLYGVTGTNGKTTTTNILGAVLREQYGREQVGLLSTINFWFGEKEEVNESKMTTLKSRKVFGYLRRMVDGGVRHVALEMTSHALDQHRLAGLKLDGAIVLNVMHEHLDYHFTMKEYALAKARILNYLKFDAPIIYKRDEWIRKIIEPLIKKRGFKNEFFVEEDSQNVRTPLFGDFNKENVLAVSMLAKHLGFEQSNIDIGVNSIKSVPGRVEWVEHESGVRALIDFALTPDALEQLYKFVREEVQGKVIAVFGATGDRDREKRPKMAQVVAEYADEIVLTRDEPYTESEDQIYAELETGLEGVDVDWQRIEDRRAAIEYALKKAQSGDVVVITGMGNFTTMAVGSEKIPWSDRGVVEAVFAAL